MDNQNSNASNTTTTTPQSTAQPVADTVEQTQPTQGSTPNETVEKPTTPIASTEAGQPTPEVKEATPEATAPVAEEAKTPIHSLVFEAGLTTKEINESLIKSEGTVTPDIKDKLVEKHGEAIGELLANQLESQYTASVEKAKAKDQAVYDQVAKEFEGITQQSGEESWKELAAWSKDNVPNDVRKELNTLLQQGGIAAKLATRELAELYKENNFSQDAQLLEADGAGNSHVEILDKATYDREVRELMNKGHDYATSPEIQRLKRSRMKAINKGM